ncbi:MAG: penicillin-binding protein 2 [Gemmatimonadetes bacterium RBG_16_66_8]|nr:MAG: penicillin-binding protein 2 [Gemmatimonadetes bacterium RBG_16_66_8]
MNWFHPYVLERRVRVARTLMWGVVASLLFAFFRVQVLGSSRYRLRSEENRLRPITIPAPRGLILDRNGVVLAENVPGYSVALIAPSADSLGAALRQLAPIVPLSSAEVAQIKRSYLRSPHQPVVIRRDASIELVSALEERRVVMPGLVVQAEPKRRYPLGAVAAHVVGYVAELTEAELTADTIRGSRHGALVGRDGLERVYDRQLRGRDGIRYVEVDALGRTVRGADVATTLDPQQGDTLRTSLEIGLQQFVAQTFPPDARGALVAMQPVTGEVLALYSAPSFDPNAFVGGYERETWTALSQSEASPLLNRAIQARYPPASPWKLVIAAAAAARGIVDLDTRMPIPCRGGLQYGNRYFRCWRPAGHGDLTLAEAIKYSCDVYFYQLGLQLDVRNMLADVGRLGFREPTGIDLPGEVQPLFPASTEYYNRRYGPRGWTRAIALNLAIGQGENAQTPLKMVAFYAGLANPRGLTPVPHLVLSPPEAGRSVGLNQEQLVGFREALLSVVQGGTATAAHIANLRIAGKTGTAQNSHGPDHGWFIAFAPEDDPQIVVGAAVEFAEHGSAVAPLVSRVIARYLLGASSIPSLAGPYELVLPSDSAPEPVPILPDTSAAPRRNGPT